MHIRTLLTLLLLVLLLPSCSLFPGQKKARPFTVAFMGDTRYDPKNTPEIDSNFERTLDLVRREGAGLLVIPGDFGYEEKKDVAADYFANIDRVLGPDFPVLGTDGNHDDWNHYRPFFQKRMARMGLGESVLAGEKLDEFAVTYGGIRFIGLGERGDAPFVRASATVEDTWRVCTWHKNTADMQTGGKGNDMDYDTYRACQNLGAIIATAHEHSYERTRTLTDLGNTAAGHGATGAFDRMEVGPGRTFVFVSGIGGASLREFICPSHDDDTWWASIFTSNYYLDNGKVVAKSCDKSAKEKYEMVDGYTYGVLFLTFNAGGDPNRAEGYFKTIDGRVIDRFQVVRTGTAPVVAGN